jgi:CheY-like chemotaxis protein
MGGRIDVVSQEGRGSNFWFAVQFGRVAEAHAAQLPKCLGGKRVLLVAREGRRRDAINRQLAAIGMEITEAGDWQRAVVEAARAKAGHRCDVMLMDCEMEEAFRAQPHLSHQRVIVMTSLCPLKDGAIVPDAAHIRRLKRPVRHGQLLNALEAAFRADTAETPLAARATSPAVSVCGPSVALGDILVAEDNPTNQKVARVLIQRLGYRVQVVGNGREAVEAVRQFSYSVVLMDCQMPEVDGFQATMEIRELEGGNRRTPIIAMTASALQGDRERCLEAQMDDYISKPVTLETLGGVLARWADRAASALGPEPSSQSAGLASLSAAVT